MLALMWTMILRLRPGASSRSTVVVECLERGLVSTISTRAVWSNSSIFSHVALRLFHMPWRTTSLLTSFAHFTSTFAPCGNILACPLSHPPQSACPVGASVSLLVRLICKHLHRQPSVCLQIVRFSVGLLLRRQRSAFVPFLVLKPSKGVGNRLYLLSVSQRFVSWPVNCPQICRRWLWVCWRRSTQKRAKSTWYQSAYLTTMKRAVSRPSPRIVA